MNRGNRSAGALVVLSFALSSCSRSALDIVGAAPSVPEPGQSISSEGGSSGTSDDGGQVVDAYQIISIEGGTRNDGGQIADSSVVDSSVEAHVDHGTLTFASGPDWSSYSGVPSSGGAVTDALGRSLGPALDVCLNQTLPPNCPTGAFLYGYFGNAGAWAGGQSLVGAHWIWRADVAPTAPGSLQLAVFQKAFTIGGPPTGSIQISADDFAEVFVNHVAVGAVGSVVSIAVAANAQNFPTTFDLSTALHAGGNTITIVGQNGPYSCSTMACPYSENPAGVVFAGTIRW